jgi:NAD(P)-dependent dehydrogenase (short-subunit alcohol dehydrogenase family)
MQDLRDQVVVITGASSGLGRETAFQLAERGCRLVLAARRVAELEKVAEGCRLRGGEALVVPTDVTREDQVQRLADAAVARWGGVDVWINNAGVTYFSPIDEGSLAEHRRVIETNLFGAIHGARAVLPIFREQRRGTLINVGSVLSKVGNPFVPSYVISKHGLAGLTEALRVEIADFPDIHVCSLFPYAIDTPHFQAGANDVGRAAYSMPPVQSPEEVARAVVGLVERPRRQVFVPRAAALGLALHWLIPRKCEQLLLRALERYHFSKPERPKEGNLFRPVREPATVHGRRRPRIGAPAFFAWAAREFVRIEVESIYRRVKGWRTADTTA